MQSKYEVIGIVGEGAFGIVYKCRNKETKEYVAIKKFKETEDEIVKKTMKRELKMLQIIKHENIVEFKDAFKRKTNLFLVFEYVDRNLLEVLQESPTGLDQSLIKKLIFQICVALKYLHEQNIIKSS
jgi:cyclin-dependent kinase-like